MGLCMSPREVEAVGAVHCLGGGGGCGKGARFSSTQLGPRLDRNARITCSEALTLPPQPHKDVPPVCDLSFELDRSTLRDRPFD